MRNVLLRLVWGSALVFSFALASDVFAACNSEIGEEFNISSEDGLLAYARDPAEDVSGGNVCIQEEVEFKIVVKNTLSVSGDNAELTCIWSGDVIGTNTATAVVGADTVFTTEITFDSTGEKNVTATITGRDWDHPSSICEISDSVSVTILKVEIVRPVTVYSSSPPYIDDSQRNYAYNAASPGVCNIDPESTCGVASLNPNLEWELTDHAGGDPLPGTTLTSSPDPPKGATPSFTFTGLPANNSSFSVIKHLGLDYPGSGCTPQTERIYVFFDRDEKNHPGTGSGTVPNWYYYWKQTSADYGTHEYRAGSRSYCGYEGGSWRCFIEDSTVSYDVDLHNVQTGVDYSYKKGINHYAFVVRHEEQHRVDLSSASHWGSSARVPALDVDGDWLKDSSEATYITGRPYSSSTNATYADLWGYGSGWDDAEDSALWQQGWPTPGASDNEDWAKPGERWN